MTAHDCSAEALPPNARLDVTDSNNAEQERIELDDRWLQAQEQERRRLAREIHDDFGQRLAVMAISLQTLHATLTDRDTLSLVREVMESFSSLCRDMQAFSHQLHPSRVETLGLIPSIAALCTDIATQHHIQTDFDHDDQSIPISADARLSLYRIVQEALHNVVKHSRASKARVRLDGDSDAISLTVEDNGTGFDMSAESTRAGIGVHSMAERVRMLGGTCDIRSGPLLKGTRIAVTIPARVTSPPSATKLA